MTAPDDGAELLDRSLIGMLVDLDPEGGGAFVAQLYEAFECDARDALVKMRAHASRGEDSVIARMAHRLKGSSVSVGAAGFSRGCREIELGAGRADGDLELRIEHARRQLDATLGALRQFLRT